MSLRELCRQHHVTVERSAEISTSSMGSQKTYNTTNRGKRPKALNCRVVEASSRERIDYAMRDIQVSHLVHVEECDPDVDERDRLVHEGDYLYVTDVKNPDRLGRFWIVGCFQATGGPK